jgi:hypothetical protein
MASSSGGPVSATTQPDGTITFTTVKPAGANFPLVAQDFTVPSTWNGKGFNATASPEHLFDGHPVIMLKGTSTLTVHLTVPTCGPYEVVAAWGHQVQQVVTWPAGSNGFIAGRIYPGTTACSSSPSSSPSASPSQTTTHPGSASATATPTQAVAHVLAVKIHAQLPDTGPAIEPSAATAAVLIALGVAMIRTARRYHKRH